MLTARVPETISRSAADRGDGWDRPSLAGDARRAEHWRDRLKIHDANADITTARSPAATIIMSCSPRMARAEPSVACSTIPPAASTWRQGRTDDRDRPLRWRRSEDVLYTNNLERSRGRWSNICDPLGPRVSVSSVACRVVADWTSDRSSPISRPAGGDQTWGRSRPGGRSARCISGLDKSDAYSHQVLQPAIGGDGCVELSRYSDLATARQDLSTRRLQARRIASTTLSARRAALGTTVSDIRNRFGSRLWRRSKECCRLLLDPGLIEGAAGRATGIAHISVARAPFPTGRLNHPGAWLQGPTTCPLHRPALAVRNALDSAGRRRGAGPPPAGPTAKAVLRQSSPDAELPYRTNPKAFFLHLSAAQLLPIAPGRIGGKWAPTRRKTLSLTPARRLSSTKRSRLADVPG